MEVEFGKNAILWFCFITVVTNLPKNVVYKSDITKTTYAWEKSVFKELGTIAGFRSPVRDLEPYQIKEVCTVNFSFTFSPSFFFVFLSQQ